MEKLFLSVHDWSYGMAVIGVCDSIDNAKQMVVEYHQSKYKNDDCENDFGQWEIIDTVYYLAVTRKYKRPSFKTMLSNYSIYEILKNQRVQQDISAEG